MSDKHALGLMLQVLPEDLVRAFELDEPPEGMRKTPARFLKALRELTDGYSVEDPADLLTLFDADGYDQIVVVRDIPFVSLCEHHVLPFTGHVHVAYLPGKHIIGLSKIPRVVRAVSRRLQVQERIGQDIATALQRAEPLGVAVLIEGHHTCMSLRGVESQGEMVTSVMEGAFRDKSEARAEVMDLLLRRKR